MRFEKRGKWKSSHNLTILTQNYHIFVIKCTQQSTEMIHTNGKTTFFILQSKSSVRKNDAIVFLSLSINCLFV